MLHHGKKSYLLIYLWSYNVYPATDLENSLYLVSVLLSHFVEFQFLHPLVSINTVSVLHDCNGDFLL